MGLVNQKKDEIGRNHGIVPLCTDSLGVHHRTRSENAMARRRSWRVDASEGTACEYSADGNPVVTWQTIRPSVKLM